MTYLSYHQAVIMSVPRWQISKDRCEKGVIAFEASHVANGLIKDSRLCLLIPKEQTRRKRLNFHRRNQRGGNYTDLLRLHKPAGETLPSLTTVRRTGTGILKHIDNFTIGHKMKTEADVATWLWQPHGRCFPAVVLRLLAWHLQTLTTAICQMSIWFTTNYVACHKTRLKKNRMHATHISRTERERNCVKWTFSCHKVKVEIMRNYRSIKCGIVYSRHKIKPIDQV